MTENALLERMERADALGLGKAVVFAAVHDQLRSTPLVHEVGGVESVDMLTQLMVRWRCGVEHTS